MLRYAQQEQQFEHELLTWLAQSAGPVGASTLAITLGARFGISQASIGRRLMAFDARGLTWRDGNRGRMLTPHGEAYLSELERHLTKQRHSSELLDALNATDQQTLLDVLVARRALERETVRLAARNATPAEIDALRRSIADQEESLADGRIPVKEDNKFHDLLAQASRNNVLLHALQLVRGESMHSSKVAMMRRRVGGQLISDHRVIVEAVAAGSGAAAEQAVVEHITTLMEDVRRYFASRGAGEG